MPRVYLLESVSSLPSQFIEVKPAEFLDMIHEAESVYCPSEDDKKAGSGYILGVFREGAGHKDIRSLDKASEVDVLTFDVDHMTDAEIEEAWVEWEKYNVTVYSTWGHSNEDDKQRLRLLVELDKPISNYDRTFDIYYRQVGEALKIKFDNNARDRVRFYFGPQHHDPDAQIRERIRGDPFPVSKIDVTAAVAAASSLDDVEGDFEVTSDRPKKQEIKKMAEGLRKSVRPAAKKLATAVYAILDGESYAPEHSRHNTTLRVTLELVRVWPQLDGNWFADQYLKEVWEKMWPEGDSVARKDWVDAVEGAKEKVREEKRNERLREVLLNNNREAEKKDVTEIAEHIGELILCHGNAYYVFDPEKTSYNGPFLAGALPVVVRDQLGRFDGISEYRITKQGIKLKTAIELCHEFGTTVKDVICYPDDPPSRLFDAERKILYMKAYDWIDWKPTYHQIAQELLEAVAGDKLDEVLAYLSKFRDLSQPLPALTLVGGPGVWKSRIMEIISRFWSDPDVSHTNRVQHFLTRFNFCILKNPTVWSEEQLLQDRHGNPQPELYRDTITSRVQTIEYKGVNGLITLKGAVRHLISVNNEDRIFSHELDTDSVQATMERFLLCRIREHAVADFERKWAGTKELKVLREGSSLLEHIRFIEENHTFVSSGRLFVAPKTDRHILLKQRFQGDLINCLWAIALGAISRETKFGRLDVNRLPLVIDEDGVLRLSPGRLQNLWNGSPAVEGTRIPRPTAQKIGNVLTKAGFKKIRNERATKAPTGGWEVDTDTLKDFIEVSEITSWESFREDCRKVFEKCPPQ